MSFRHTEADNDTVFIGGAVNQHTRNVGTRTLFRYAVIFLKRIFFRGGVFQQIGFPLVFRRRCPVLTAYLTDTAV